ncbi:MAG: DUF4367 domain-containing protein [Clostridia bacterium]|nr:DUF4367 domain-containing protein [Clostridia bacterium]
MPEQHKDYSGFDRMSTEMLEEILRSDFELSNDEESDMDAVLYIMGVIAKRKQEAKNREYPDAEQAWKSFNENYRNLKVAWYEEEDDCEEDDNNNSITSLETVILPGTARKKRPLQRFTGIAAAAVVVILCASFTANAFGYNIWQIFAQWTNQTFGFVSSGAEVQSEPEKTADAQYDSLQEALDAYGITEELVPTWMPSGYELEAVEVIDSSMSTHFTASYKIGDDYVLILIRNIRNGNYSSFEKDDTIVETFEVNNIEHYIMSNLECNTAVWMNGTNECSITTSVSCDELEKIIQSIYER